MQLPPNWEAQVLPAIIGMSLNDITLANVRAIAQNFWEVDQARKSAHKGPNAQKISAVKRKSEGNPQYNHQKDKGKGKEKAPSSSSSKSDTKGKKRQRGTRGGKNKHLHIASTA